MLDNWYKFGYRWWGYLEMKNVAIINKPMSSNCYILSQGVDCVIVDPGTKYPIELEDYIEKNNLNPRYIILTHEHYDHIEGCNHLRIIYPNVKIIASEVCSKNIQDDRWNLSRFAADNGIGFALSAADIVIEKDTAFQLIGFEFYFLLTPGHSLGSMCFWVENSFFSGDMLIPDEKVILKLKGGNLKDYNVSLTRMKEILSQGNFVVYPGHKECFYYDRVRIQNIDCKIK